MAAGLVIAVITRLLIKKLPAHPAGSALILLMPFAAYAAADAAHGSGVLAVVTVALALSRYGDAESSKTRLVTSTTWEIIELLVTGAAFAFVGLELRAVAAEVDGQLQHTGRSGADRDGGGHRRPLRVDLPGRRHRREGPPAPQQGPGRTRRLARDGRRVVGGDARRGHAGGRAGPAARLP